MNTTQRMEEEIRTELSNGESLSNIADRSAEFVDGYLPIYNGDIIQEWKDMPSEYDDRGGDEMGRPSDITIVGLMIADLFVYYTELFGQAVESVKEWLNEHENCAYCEAGIAEEHEPEAVMA